MRTNSKYWNFSEAIILLHDPNTGYLAPLLQDTLFQCFGNINFASEVDRRTDAFRRTLAATPVLATVPASTRQNPFAELFTNLPRTPTLHLEEPPGLNNAMEVDEELQPDALNPDCGNSLTRPCIFDPPCVMHQHFQRTQEQALERLHRSANLLNGNRSS